jgi:hypothetical protein
MAWTWLLNELSGAVIFLAHMHIYIHTKWEELHSNFYYVKYTALKEQSRQEN